MVLSAPREKHELQEGKALKDMKAALQHGYYEQKRKMGGTIDIKDKPLMHQVMVKCNYLNKQESNFLAKQSLNYKAHNMNDMNDAGSIFNRQKDNERIDKIHNSSIISYRDYNNIEETITDFINYLTGIQ